MIFEPIEDASALIFVEKQGYCESKLYRCVLQGKEHERYIKRGSYYVRIHPKIGSGAFYYTSKNNIKVETIVPDSEGPKRK